MEERAWGSAGYERFEDTSGDEAFGPLQVQYPVGARTPQELPANGPRSGVQFGLLQLQPFCCSSAVSFGAKRIAKMVGPWAGRLHGALGVPGSGAFA